jgi:hypothetical protein
VTGGLWTVNVDFGAKAPENKKASRIIPADE